MASQRQIEANRRNARKSTGPKTPEGKLRSSKNRLSHGLFAEDLVLEERGESEEDFLALFQSFNGYFQPVGPVEELLVRQVATGEWRLQRLLRSETGLFREKSASLTVGFSLSSDKPVERFKPLPGRERERASDLLGYTFHCATDSFSKISMYQARLERSRDRALERLERLRQARLSLPHPAEKTVAAAQSAPQPPSRQPFLVNQRNEANPESEHPPAAAAGPASHPATPTWPLSQDLQPPPHQSAEAPAPE